MSFFALVQGQYSAQIKEEEIYSLQGGSEKRK
jgi:hypothetical protein